MGSTGGGDRLGAVVKAYDIRGAVPERLDADVARALGSAFAQVVVRPEGHTRLVLGHDMRVSSPQLAAAFADGALAQGVDVLMIGLCATDQLYYASGTHDLPGVMVTASHNPAGDNGFKLCRPGARPVGQDSGLAEIRDLARWQLDRGAVHDLGGVAAGQVELADTLEPYVEHVRSLVEPGPGRALTVVVDAGNGMGGLTAPAVLETVPETTLVPVHCELDGTFPHHPANPLDPANLQDLRAAVLEHGADLGLAFDGDADRVVVVDETGAPVDPSAIAALVADRLLDLEVSRGTAPGAVAIVHGAVVSRALPDLIRARGARPVRSRIGHSFVKTLMGEHDAVFGAEHSAHYYFRDFWYADCGMIAALHVIAALAAAGDAENPARLSGLVARHHPHPSSGEINFPVDDADAVLGRLASWGRERGAATDRLDGLTLSSPDAEDGPWWWLNVRRSNTEDLLRLNVEAADRETLEEIVRQARALITGSDPGSTQEDTP